MNIRIYQVNMSRDTNRIAFMNYEHLPKFQGSQEIDSAVYDKVFEGDVQCETIEDVYAMFNQNHPKGYKGRSLSVSDVVEVIESDSMKSGFYFCDSIGFKEISFAPDMAQISENCLQQKQAEKISVLLVQPNQYPKMIEIEDTLEAMQKVVGGDIEEYMPFEDDVAIVCNEEGKINGLPLNRAIYTEPETVEMSYHDMKQLFRQAEKERKSTVGYIVFSADSFDKPYTEEQRTYVVGSDNKAFRDGMGGYSIFGSSLDGSDVCVRLEAYMADERGGKDGWKIEKCYVKDDSHREMADIIAGTFFVAYAPMESEKFLSLPKHLEKKYGEKFKFPEKFFRTDNGIKAVPFKPISKDKER